MKHYYNEIDPKAARWLRGLIRAGLIPDGDVDERDVRQVAVADVADYQSCHWFAGIGGWAYALRLAGWPDDRPVWTGSCPCQPFSSAGKRKGTGDDRHLWPEFLRLVAERRPPVVFGEQVASRLGREWLAGVRADLEALGHRVGAADLCAAGAGSPHIRQRLYWVADAPGIRHGGGKAGTGAGVDADTLVSLESQGRGPAGRLANANGRVPGDGGVQRGRKHGQQPADRKPADGLVHPQGRGKESEEQPGRVSGVKPASQIGRVADTKGQREGAVGRIHGGAGTERGRGPGFWSGYDLVPCRDGKVRRVEPGTFPLAHGIPARVDQLRGLGNAIVPQIAAVFIRAYLEAEEA